MLASHFASGLSGYDDLKFHSSEDHFIQHYIGGNTLAGIGPLLYAHEFMPNLVACASFCVEFKAVLEDHKLSSALRGFTTVDVLELLSMASRLCVFLPRHTQMVSSFVQYNVHPNFLIVPKLSELPSDARVISGSALSSFEDLMLYLLLTADSSSIDVVVSQPNRVYNLAGNLPVPTNYYIDASGMAALMGLIQGRNFTLTAAVSQHLVVSTLMAYLDGLLQLKLVESLDYAFLLLSGCLSGFFRALIITNGVARREPITRFGTRVSLQFSERVFNRILASKTLGVSASGRSAVLNVDTWLVRFWSIREFDMIRTWSFGTMVNRFAFKTDSLPTTHGAWGLFVRDEGQRDTIRVCAASRIDKIMPSLEKNPNRTYGLGLIGNDRTVCLQPPASWMEFVEIVAWGNLVTHLCGAGQTTVAIGGAVMSAFGGGFQLTFPLVPARVYLPTKLGFIPPVSTVQALGGFNYYGFNPLLNVGVTAGALNQAVTYKIGPDAANRITFTCVSALEREHAVKWFVQFIDTRTWDK